MHNLLSDFTALENVTIPLLNNGLSWEESNNKAKKYLSMVNLSKRFKHNALLDCELLREVYINLLDVKEPKFNLMNNNGEKKIIQNNNDFTPPTECTFKLSGKNVYDKMLKMLEKLYNEKIILDHGMEVGKELAKVLSGGDTTLENTLSEDDLYKLELDAFMKLIETEKTQDRIKHTLKTGKPLVN